MQPIQLGGPRALRRREEEVRDGALVVQSPRGLAPATRLLVEALPGKPVASVLTGLDTEAAAALVARALWPAAEISWFHFDAYVGEKVTGVLEHNGVEDVAVIVAADPPDGPFDLCAFAFPKGGESLLVRDMVEAAHARLAVGGRLVVSTDGKPDNLRATLKKVFGNVVPAAVKTRRGAAFLAERRRADVRVADRSHVLTPELEVGDRRVALQIETRPGTFSHGRVDRGTKALLGCLDVSGTHRVLDLGAGCGLLGLAVAVAEPRCRVTLVDSNARAIGCAERNAVRCGVADRVDAHLLAASPEVSGAGTYDLVLANPPYFANFRIAEAFVEGAHAALAPGGLFALVAKAGPQHAEHVEAVFGNAAIVERDGYAIVSATKDRAPA